MNAAFRPSHRRLFRTSTAILWGAWLGSAPAHAKETLAERSERMETEAIERMPGDGLCSSAVGAIKPGLANFVIEKS